MCSFNPFSKIKKRPLDLLNNNQEVAGVIVFNELGEPVLLTDFTNRKSSVKKIIENLLEMNAEKTIICTFCGKKEKLIKTINLIKMGNYSNFPI